MLVFVMLVFVVRNNTGLDWNGLVCASVTFNVHVVMQFLRCLKLNKSVSTFMTCFSSVLNSGRKRKAIFLGAEPREWRGYTLLFPSPPIIWLHPLHHLKILIKKMRKIEPSCFIKLSSARFCTKKFYIQYFFSECEYAM